MSDERVVPARVRCECPEDEVIASYEKDRGPVDLKCGRSLLGRVGDSGVGAERARVEVLDERERRRLRREGAREWQPKWGVA